MKNIKKRLLSLVLAVVMVLSMSMSVFASETTPITVTVQIAAKGSTAENHQTGDRYSTKITVDTVAGASIESIVKDAFAQKGLTAEWKTVKDYKDASITHQALNALTANGVTYKTWIASDYTEGAGWTWSAKLTDGTVVNNDNYMCCRSMADSGTITLSFAYADYTNY